MAKIPPLYTDEKLMHVNMPQVEEMRRKIMADVQDTSDEIIVQSCITSAQNAGFTDLYLLDKEFVMTALQRQVPQTVKVVDMRDGLYTNYYCPVCGKQQKRSWKNKKEGCYCERCGQRLKGGW